MNLCAFRRHSRGKKRLWELSLASQDEFGEALEPRANRNVGLGLQPVFQVREVFHHNSTFPEAL